MLKLQTVTKMLSKCEIKTVQRAGSKLRQEHKSRSVEHVAVPQTDAPDQGIGRCLRRHLCENNYAAQHSHYEKADHAVRGWRDLA